MMQAMAVLIAVAAVIAALYVVARPHWAFVLLIVMFPLKQLLQVYIPFIGSRPIIVNVAIGSLVLVAVGVRFMRREQIGSSYINPITVMTLVLYVLWSVGIFYSPARELNLERYWTDLTYQILLLVVMPLLVVDLHEFRRSLYGLMIVGSIISLLIMFNPHSEYHSGRLTLDLGMLATGREKGNVLATASMGAMVALVAAMIRPARATTLVTALRVAAFLIGMGMAIGSGSRGQVLAASVTGIVFYPISRKLANPRQFFVLVTGFMALVAGLYASFKLFIGQQNQERWDPFQMLADTTMRLDMAMNLFNHYIASPAHWLFGLGTGFYATISTDRSVARDYVHNVVAEVLCEHGIAGITLFAAIFYLLVKYSYRLWILYRDDPPMRSVAALMMGFGFYTLLEALKQGSMSYPAPFFWWVIIAKLARHEEKVAIESIPFVDVHEEEGEAVPDDGLFPQPAFASNDPIR